MPNPFSGSLFHPRSPGSPPPLSLFAPPGAQGSSLHRWGWLLLYLLGGGQTGTNADPTVPLAFYASLGLVLFMVAGAREAVRRRWYELFLLLHQWYPAFILASLWHAPGAWQYLLGSLSLWAVDQLLRLSGALTAGPPIRRLRAIGRYTLLELEGPLPSQRWAGQFAWINIPTLSSTEWHPFAITSSPRDEHTAFVVRSLRPGSFSSKLWGMARQCSPGFSEDWACQRIEVRVEGPYGTPVDYGAYTRIVLVAGGIGMAAIHAHLR